MKIGIDARSLSHPQPGGFKTYTVNLIQALAAIDRQNDYVLYTDREMPDADDQVKLPSNFTTRVVSAGSLLGFGMVLREQWLLRHAAKDDKVDVFHSPCLTAPQKLHCRLVVTMHDMIWRWPDRFASAKSKGSKVRKRWWQTLYFKLMPGRSAQHADAVITVSQSASDDLIKELYISKPRLFITREAAPLHCRRVTDAAELIRVREKFKLPPNYIMAIGSADPRKNILSLIEAYSQLAPDIRQRFPLAIVWTHSWLSSEAKSCIEDRGLTEQVRSLVWASNEDMYALYSMASLFAFPSRYEGFGLPLLEAMVCGAPIVAAKNSSIPEVVGEAAVLFDAERPDTLAQALTETLTNDALRNALITKGYQQATRFSWEQCARETLAVYEFARNNPSVGESVSTRIRRVIQQVIQNLPTMRLSRFIHHINRDTPKPREVSPVVGDNTAL